MWKICSRSEASQVSYETIRHWCQTFGVDYARKLRRRRGVLGDTMRRFTSAAHAQRFLSVHGLVQNLFRVGRHLLRAVHHRSLRTRSVRVWDEVTCAY